jgi:Mrp family chromosome partitioning ATPase
MKELLATLSTKYDHILIDSSPLTNVTDPVILSTIVDGVILVVRASHTKRDLVTRSCSELGSVGARILGVVLNNVNMEREGYDYYYSNYGEHDQQGAKATAAGAGD